ncbi:MAG TPA: L,D-transpeptidase family protein [Bauldia sp.]|nr:L,D-transpeptidase family protein [Bauldia sp.]
MAGLSAIDVFPDPADPARGILHAGAIRAPCALGRRGVVRDKREGDGGTPAGTLLPVALLHRADRLLRPPTFLPSAPIARDDGWCDDPGDRNYNRQVRLPFRAGHERLWRDDALYDLVIVLDWNLAEPIPGKGSAIFLHLASSGFAPTAGCIAIDLATMRRLLAGMTPATRLSVHLPQRI